ncbi:MAG: peptidase C69 [Promethearchaeota archaeon]|nr:MAG: peptidase C69 [Candidatus Lokiarchaeota archaeon]
MCDTLVSLPKASKNNCVIFGKNSDRPSGEVQLITYSPRMNHSKGEELKCTYITIPQAKETAAIILSQPWWMWGAEMGCNEYGVVIGNEAVYSFEPQRNEGLLGMDLLRLGLERAKTARESLDIIIKLLECHHQGGGCSYNDPSWTYHNSFLIADPHKAFVLETADDWWIAERVMDVGSISNGLTIRGKGDLRREGIINHAIQKGYCKDEDDFDFAVTFSGSPPSNSIYSRIGKSKQLLTRNKGNITGEMMMEFLRDHQAGICMHGGFESTGSQVSELRDDGKNIHWFTGTTLPCMSIYKPYIFPIDDQYVLPPGPYTEKNSDWYWVRNKNSKSKIIIEKKRKIEKNIIGEMQKILKNESLLQKTDDFNKKIQELNKMAWKKIRQFF